MDTHSIATKLSSFEGNVSSSWSQDNRTVDRCEMVSYLVIREGVQYLMESYSNGDYRLTVYAS